MKGMKPAPSSSSHSIMVKGPAQVPVPLEYNAIPPSVTVPSSDWMTNLPLAGAVKVYQTSLIALVNPQPGLPTVVVRVALVLV